MTVLAIDSSGEMLSVAVLSSQPRSDQVRLLSRRDKPAMAGRTSEELLPIIIDVLEEVKLTSDQLQFVAVALGPGSFTGTRIGIATALGLTGGDPRKVLGVPTLAARLPLLEMIPSMPRNQSEPLAAARSGEGLRVLVPTLEANSNEVFFALYWPRKQDDVALSGELLSCAVARREAVKAVARAAMRTRFAGENGIVGLPTALASADDIELVIGDVSKIGERQPSGPLTPVYSSAAEFVGREAIRELRSRGVGSGKSFYQGRLEALYGKGINARTVAERLAANR